MERLVTPRSTDELSVYFEILSLRHFVAGWFRIASLRRALRRGASTIYFVDISAFAGRILPALFRALGIQVTRLNFEIKDIKDARGELIRVRIYRQDLFDLKASIIASEPYLELSKGGWQTDRIREYVNKALVDELIVQPDSAARALFLIEVVKHHADSAETPPCLFVMRARPWFACYQLYASRHGIDLAAVAAPRSARARVTLAKTRVILFLRPYLFWRRLQERRLDIARERESVSLPQLLLDGPGNVNLSKNGEHSDFFWYTNSEFPARNIITRPHSETEQQVLSQHGIGLVRSERPRPGGWRTTASLPRRPRGGRFDREYKQIRSLVAAYHSSRTYWGAAFPANNVKLWLTWEKYDHHHMAMADAIQESGGISLCWPIAFDGYRCIECESNTNVVFSFSRFGADMAKQCGSVWDYNVITGYLRDYAGPLLRPEALLLRQKLQSNGAERIVLVIDENSGDDPRWHTGHALQRENYSAILHEVLNTSWLGVVFKPKVAQTLRRRLGDVAELLQAAEQTGRCHVYETSGRHTTSAPPLLAGLSADVCIHGHLSSGTAALECALEGLPTLLVDREGVPDSKLWELPAGKVVFKSWREAIDAMMEHFRSPNGVPGFGDWSPIIDDLDPFRDGMAANRMGTYLHWLVQGFEAGKERSVILEEAADRYRGLWGADKVLSG